MRKFTSLLAMAFIALMSLTLTSCDEDADIAHTLDGTWKGYMDIGLRWDDRYYASTTSEITFDADGLYTTHGTGYWIDRYSDAPWDYVANHIEWSVSNSVIRIHFIEEDSYATIRDYSLDDGYFYGTLVSGNSSADFKLVQTSSPRKWNYYWYGTSDWYNSWGYSGYARKQGSVDASSRSKEASSRSMDKSKVAADSVPEMIRLVHEGK